MAQHKVYPNNFSTCTWQWHRFSGHWVSCSLDMLDTISLQFGSSLPYYHLSSAQLFFPLLTVVHWSLQALLLNCFISFKSIRFYITYFRGFFDTYICEWINNIYTDMLYICMLYTKYISCKYTHICMYMNIYIHR